MNLEHLTKLVEHFNLGCIKEKPQRVEGGLLHSMWRVDTEAQSYAIKQLSNRIDLKDESIITNYEITEHIAFLFAGYSIPAICAINKDKKCLFVVDEIGYLVYPWVNAKSLGNNAVSEFYALKIASMLAKIHHVNLNIKEIEEPKFDIHSDESIVELVSLSKVNNMKFSSTLSDCLSILLEVNKNYQDAINILKKHTVISHGDLDQKNILWDLQDNPFLIDWESARKLNPTYELINAALDWSGISTVFNKIIFKKMIEAYQEAGGSINMNEVEAAF